MRRNFHSNNFAKDTVFHLINMVKGLAAAPHRGVGPAPVPHLFLRSLLRPEAPACHPMGANTAHKPRGNDALIKASPLKVELEGFHSDVTTPLSRYSNRLKVDAVPRIGHGRYHTHHPHPSFLRTMQMRYKKLPTFYTKPYKKVKSFHTKDRPLIFSLSYYWELVERFVF